jgi:4-hydroxy-3-polyprenylbenzoate decarboxylase
VQIQDYEKLAQYAFSNLDPAADIYFSQGPMDVLDHSCSKLGFGGKMCIDGTAKYEEEKDDTSAWKSINNDWLNTIADKFDEVHAVNTSLLKKDIPVLVISVKKSKKGQVRDLHQQLCQAPEMEAVKMVLYVEHTVNANDLTVALWRFCNNLDPKRDSSLVQRPSSIDELKTYSCMGLDGTIKSKEMDNFQRDWPNIIVSDEATIKSVDAKWDKLGLGEFLPSPSLKFQDQVYGLEAVVQA